jgi:cation diffusion facilitator CzcD-associated flavoprotein CzcO
MWDVGDVSTRICKPSRFSGLRSIATPGNGYLEALVGPKTTAYTEQIQRITKNGFIDPDGVEHHVDVIICATGFDTSYNLKYPVYVNGVDMNEKWRSRDKVPSYLSVGYAEVRFGQMQISSSTNNTNRFQTTSSMVEHIAPAPTGHSSQSFRRIPTTRLR